MSATCKRESFEKMKKLETDQPGRILDFKNES